jgi:hypothetical protein
MKFFKWYGVLVIFAVMWLGTSFAYWTTLRDRMVHEAEEHGQEFKEDEFRTEYWAGYFENHQSEYAQLFFQALFIGAMGVVLFKKEKEDILRIEQKLDHLLVENNVSPQKLAALQKVE